MWTLLLAMQTWMGTWVWVTIESSYLCCKEALRKQHYFTDLLKIWYNNNHRPEQSFHRLRELSPTSITRIHCNEDANTAVKGNLLSFKLKA